MKAWLISLFGNALNTIWTLMAGIILARSLAPNDRGEVAEILFWVQIFVLFFYLSVNEKIILDKYSKKTLVLARFVFPFALFFYFVALLVFSNYKTNLNIPIFLSYGLYLFAIYFIRTVFVTGILESKNYNVIVASNGFYGIAYFLSLAFLYFLNGYLSVGMAVLSSAIGELFSFIYITLRCKKLNVDIKGMLLKNGKVWSVAFSELKALLRNHLVFVISSISKNLDRLIVFYLFSKSEIGLYVVAASIPNVVIQFFSRASQDILLTKSSDGSLDFKGFLNVVYLTFIFGAICIGLAILYGELFLTTIFGVEYIKSAPLLVPLILYAFTYALKDMVSKYIKAKRVRYSFHVEVLTIVLAIFAFLSTIGLHKESIYSIVIVLTAVNVIGFLYAIYKLKWKL